MNAVSESHSRLSRARGWLLVMLGAVLTIGMAAIATNLALLIQQPGTSRWTGTHEFTVRVFELFATVFVFGIVAIIGGLGFLRRGRSSWPVIVLMLLLVATMVLLGRDIMQVASPQ